MTDISTSLKYWELTYFHSRMSHLINQALSKLKLYLLEVAPVSHASISLILKINCQKEKKFFFWDLNKSSYIFENLLEYISGKTSFGVNRDLEPFIGLQSSYLNFMISNKKSPHKRPQDPIWYKLIYKFIYYFKALQKEL